MEVLERWEVCELTISGACASKLRKVISVGVKFLNAIPSKFRHIDVAGAIENKGYGCVKHGRSELGDVISVGVELLNSLISIVHDVYISGAVKGDPSRMRELSVFCSGRFS